jgi:hypothetical protein
MQAVPRFVDAENTSCLNTAAVFEQELFDVVLIFLQQAVEIFN